jgi:CTP synthase
MLSPPVVPHVTNEIQDWVERVAKIPVDDSGEEPEVCVIEVCSVPQWETDCMSGRPWVNLKFDAVLVLLAKNEWFGYADFCIRGEMRFQLGGTVGDIESAPFVEAMRQFQFRVGHDVCLCGGPVAVLVDMLSPCGARLVSA